MLLKIPVFYNKLNCYTAGRRKSHPSPGVTLWLNLRVMKSRPKSQTQTPLWNGFKLEIENLSTRRSRAGGNEMEMTLIQHRAKHFYIKTSLGDNYQGNRSTSALCVWLGWLISTAGQLGSWLVAFLVMKKHGCLPPLLCETEFSPGGRLKITDYMVIKKKKKKISKVFM